MVTYNQPFVWFDSLDEEASRAVVDAAKRRAPEIRRKFREREEGIRQLRLERFREKEAKLKEKEAKALKDRMELIIKVDAMGGLWRSEEDMKQGLIKVKAGARGEGKGKQLECIKQQMAYRRRILEQPVADPKDWMLSQNGLQLDVAELSLKLAKLIGQTASYVEA